MVVSLESCGNCGSFVVVGFSSFVVVSLESVGTCGTFVVVSLESGGTCGSLVMMSWRSMVESFGGFGHCGGSLVVNFYGNYVVLWRVAVVL